MSSSKIGPVTAMVNQLEELRQEVNQLNCNYLRSLAEFDNFRRRKEREIQELCEFAHEPLLKELVPVLDNFERALQAAEAIGDQASDSHNDSLKKGIQLIFRQLQDVLGKFGFEQYSCIGEVFDPRRCEAVAYEEVDGEGESLVVAEAAKGYRYKTKILRPAMVTVAKPRGGLLCQK